MYPISVSISVLAYNHKNFIRQMLEGVIMQKTNFKFEILIHDDASTDGTADIIREYQVKFPQIIKPILQQKNQFSQGVDPHIYFNWPRAQGKYLCLCEGDDYWTDPFKLQKQKDFLDAYPECSLVFHPVDVHWQDGSHPNDTWGPDSVKYGSLDQQIWVKNIIPTLSVMYRWRFHKEPLTLFPQDMLPGDWFLHMLHAQVGKIGFLPETMGVYRKHAGGLWYHPFNDEKYFVNNFWKHVNFFIYAERQFNKDYTSYIAEIFGYFVDFYQKNPSSNLGQLLRNQAPQKWDDLIKRLCNQSGSISMAYLRWKLSSAAKRRVYKKEYFSLKIGKALQNISL